MAENWWEIDSLAKANLELSDEADTTKNAKLVLHGLPDGDIALEIGSGSGRPMREMSKHFRFVHGVDISQTMVEYSKVLLKDFPQCTTIKNDGMTLPYPDNTFDFVWSHVVFQHFQTQEVVESYIKETYRVLKPGGMCRIQTVKGTPIHSADGNHSWLFPDEKDFLKIFLDAGFDAYAKMGPEYPEHIWVTAQKPETHE